MSINRVWVSRLECGAKTWAECPDARKLDVDNMLRRDVVTGVITAERYTEITGEEYQE